MIFLIKKQRPINNSTSVFLFKFQCKFLTLSKRGIGSCLGTSIESSPVQVKKEKVKCDTNVQFPHFFGRTSFLIPPLIQVIHIFFENVMKIILVREWRSIGLPTLDYFSKNNKTFLSARILYILIIGSKVLGSKFI